MSIVVGGENLICTLRSWLSRWSIEDSQAIPRHRFLVGAITSARI
jgi:hypothetical protein